MKAVRYRKFAVEICRIILGATFIFSGLVKAIDPVGGALKIEDYLAAFSLSYFNPLSTLIAINLFAIEFMLGLCILLAVYRKFISTCMLFFMSFMTLLTLCLAIFNPVHDCGCFGDAIILTNWETFFKNAFVLFPASIVTFIYRKLMTPAYTFKAYWFVVLFGYLFPVGFGFYNYINLPIIDFRPFKIGVNIPEQMAFPEDAPHDEYLYIYEKDGKKTSFTPATSPAGDSTWTFVKAKLIKEGYVPPILSFELSNAEGVDLTDRILSNDNGVFLLIAHNIDKASDKHTDEINNLYDYAVEHHIPFYGVTNSSKDEINAWINNTGAEYPFLFADDVTLKTIIRSNPGLVLLKAGTILKKWSHNYLPSEENTDTEIQGLLNATDTDAGKEKSPLLWIICCFALPLLLVWIYDYLRNRRKKHKEDNKTA